jgi:hypothetical protein
LIAREGSEAEIGQVGADEKWQTGVEARMLSVIQSLDKDRVFPLRRQDQQQNAFDEADPTEKRDDDGQRAGGPNVVRENNREIELVRKKKPKTLKPGVVRSQLHGVCGVISGSEVRVLPRYVACTNLSSNGPSASAAK